jgi:CheY-like chemotaxis protein/class 3 adenylate cyclase
MTAHVGTMLVVDDDALNRTLLATGLEEEGYTVKVAEDGQQALEMLHTQPFDVVLLDLLMPKMDGFQVLERMRATSTLQHIPVIIVSAADEMESVVRCIEMGATDYITKPFDPVLLRTRVNASLAAKRLHDQEQTYAGKMLVVDDDALSRVLLATSLEEEGYTVETAEDGQQALEMLCIQPFDVVLLDLLMPEMDGFQVLERMKADSALQHIPVIVVSASDEMESVVRCIETGATDHLPKPFDPTMLRARINASLAAKRLRDQEQAYLKMIQAERQKSERLLLNILPKPIADRLKLGEDIIADSFAEVTVLFADIVNFTPLSAHMSPTELVVLLNEIFSTFDDLAEQHGLEKIKTIGDAYMVVGGLPTSRPDHAEAIADMALDMKKSIAQFNVECGEPLNIRVGINTGPVIAGVIGTKKFSYDLWGDTVNTASRMESRGLAGHIQVTAATYERLQDKYLFEERGTIQVKGKGEMTTYLLTGRKTGYTG